VRRESERELAEPKPVNGRVPPHDLDAEAAVLSAIMLSVVDGVTITESVVDACVDVGLRPESFYSEANKRVFEAALALHAEGKPTDVVMLGNWLKSRDRISQIGGMAYLSETLNAAPAVVSVRKYAQLVVEKWRVRRLIATCQKIAAEGYFDYGPTNEFLERAEAEVHAIAHEHQRANDGLRHIIEYVKEAYVDVAEAAKRADKISGIATGMERYDRIVSGLHLGDLTIVGARPGMGKALRVDAKVLCPNGWVRMGDLRVGDLVIGSDGKPYPIVGVYDQGVKDVFRVVVDDGGETVCCDEHLWVTRTRSDRVRKRKGTTKALAEIRATLKRPGGGANHSLPFVDAVEFEPKGDRAISPWLLGVYLGDGCSDERRVRFSNPERDIQRRIAEALPAGDTLNLSDHKEMSVRNPEGSAFLSALRDLGLVGAHAWEKFIPKEYLFASVSERVALLQGIVDSDGFVTDARRSIEYTTTSARLRDDVAFLVGGLGGRVTWQAKATHYTKNGERVACREAYRMILSFPTGLVVPVSSAKHLAKYQPGTNRLTERFIKDVIPCGKAECRCIAVDSPDNQFVTDDFLVTHNTGLVLQMLANIGMRGENATLLESLEMPGKQIGLRAVCMEARVDLGKVRQGFLGAGEWGRVTASIKGLNESAIWVNDRAGSTLSHIRADIRRVRVEAEKRGKKLKVVAVDYLQLMTSPPLRGRSQVTREQEVSSFSRGLKILAKEEQLAIIALAQLNRNVETRTDKRPQISDLRESGSIEQDADNIVFVYRDEYYAKEETSEPNIAELIVAKQRNGATGTAKVRFDKEWVRFDNLAEGEYLDE
jgi:replicative DNA helicase